MLRWISVLLIIGSVMGMTTDERSRVANEPVPLFYFRLPVSIVGPSQFFAGEGGGGPHVPPADSYSPPQTLAELGTYRYGVRPNIPRGKGGAQALYEVTIYKTIEAAQAANAEHRDNIDDGSGQPFAPIPFVRPINDNAWLRGRHAVNRPGTLFCSTVGGIRYRNIRVYALAQNFQSPTLTGELPCTAEDGWALRVMQALYPRIVSFSSTHPAAAALSAPTRVTVIEPFDGQGRLLPGYDAVYKMTKFAADASCSSGSFVTARADAFRCFAGNQIMDPCFTPPVPRPTIVACVGDPRVRYAEVLRLVAPLPQRDSVKPAQGQPWAVDLATAEQCDFESGATRSVGDLRLNYGCSPGGVIYGDVDKKDHQWSAFVWRGSPSANPQQSQFIRVGVMVAYY